MGERSSEHDACPNCAAQTAQIEELKRLLKYATVYSSFAKHFPTPFLKDAMEALK
jgi:hypothetical protein